MENIVAVELLRRSKEIYYYKDKNGAEVDFVIKKGLKIDEMIQVCYNLSDIRIKNKEIKSLIKAGKELKCQRFFIITWDYEDEEKYKDSRILFVPLWNWLLYHHPQPND